MREYRYSAHNVITRSEETGSRHISGYAVVFNSESYDLGGFTEIISPEALNGVIEKSDVLYLLDHDVKRGVLARCRYGSGSLTLTIDEKGLKYECDLPETALGDEVLEGLKRGDISQSSFGFTCAEDEWIKRPDGSILRTINKIEELFDVSSVYHPAYGESSVKCDTRGMQSLLENDNNAVDSMKKNKRNADEILDEVKKLMRELEDVKEQEEKSEDEQEDENRSDDENADEEETKSEDEEEKSDEEEQEDENRSEDEEDDENRSEDEEEKSEDEEEKSDESDDNDKENCKRNITQKKMKNFSLINAINAVVEGRAFDEATQEMVKEGRNINARAGLNATGQISIPVNEYRADIATDATPATVNGVFATVNEKGGHAVATEKWDILGPLRARSVIAQAGGTFLTGLSSNISIPCYSGSNVGWAGEIEAAMNGAGAWSEIEFKPLRITTFVDLSKQILIQGNQGIEEFIRRDIVNALAEKLEKTFLGSEAATAKKPAGIFAGVTAMTAAVKFGDLIDMEATLENNNVYGNLSYILSPKAKAELRKTTKDSGSGRFVLEDGEIEGIKCYSSSAVTDKGVILGNFEDYVVAQFGAIDITVDTVSQAVNGCVRLVINAYFDAKPRRAESFVKKILK